MSVKIKDLVPLYIPTYTAYYGRCPIFPSLYKVESACCSGNGLVISCIEESTKAAVTDWMRQAENRVKWRTLGEIYVLDCQYKHKRLI